MVKRAPQKSGKSNNPGSSSKKSPANNTGADDSFIVFSNSTRDPPPTKQTSKDTGKAAGKDGVDLLGESVKQPSVKQIIGGNSWTGKLPVNMLSEHCQKQKWEKPEYTMVGSLHICILCILYVKSAVVQNARRLCLHGHP